MQETHFEVLQGSACICLGRSGSQSSGLDREIAAMSVLFKTASMVSRLLIPPTVEYSLAEKGKTLIPALESIYRWADEQMQRQDGNE